MNTEQTSKNIFMYLERKYRKKDRGSEKGVFLKK